MGNQELVESQYGAAWLRERVNDALDRAGLGQGTISWSDLVPLDQFHVRGLGATRELADDLLIEAGAELLDVGCGLGGPARFLAATYDCRVTGVDLSQPFVDLAAMLSQRCGMQERTIFHQADALALPFPDASFALAWTQHVAMNIAERAKFYSEIRRVLHVGGRLAVYDVIAGDGRPLVFPVPWARQPDMSFLLTADDMRAVMKRSGFQELAWADKTEAAATWVAELRSRLASSPSLSLSVVMGPGFLEMARNLSLNLLEGRVRLVQGIFGAV